MRMMGVANVPPRKHPGLKADVREFGNERFLAGPNRIQLTHLGQILFQQHVFKARKLVCGVDDGTELAEFPFQSP